MDTKRWNGATKCAVGILDLFGGGDLFDDEVMENTPKRFAKVWYDRRKEYLAGLPKLTSFAGCRGQVVRVQDIEYASVCEHHLLPFWGKVNIEFMVSDKILGLSKYSRLVSWLASRPSLQEGLCQNIYQHLMIVLEPEWLVVSVSGEHSCVRFRGVKDSCSNTIAVMDSRVVGDLE
jgi:GTP cyclohydrolase I